MLLTRFLTEIKTQQLVQPGDKILLGVSGGSDSVALLDLFKRSSRELGTFLAIAHLDHRIRGKAAENDEKFVAGLAEKCGLPYFSTRTDVPALAKKERLSLEDAARKARYRFFEQVCAKNGFNKVALGHMRDDQLETILIKFLRGTGLKGLTGITPSRKFADLMIIRPLLSFSKKELQAYCKSNRLKWREDSTNDQLNYTRNRIRKLVLPRLKELNPGLETTIQHTAGILREENRYLDELAAAGLAQTVQKQVPAGIRLDIKKILAYPKAIQRRIVRLALEKVQGNLQDIYLPFIENFLDNELTTIKLDKHGKLHISKERL